jgi:putative membrane protein
LFPPSVSILNTITEGLKSTKSCDAFCKPIDPCGEILTRHFPRSADDSDVLPNKSVTES